MGENKFKATTSAGKVIASVFLYNEGILLGEFMKRGATVNSERYVRTLNKLKHRIRSFEPNNDTMKTALFLQSRFSAHLLPSFWAPMKVTLRERRFADHDGLKHNVRQER